MRQKKNVRYLITTIGTHFTKQSHKYPKNNFHYECKKHNFCY